MFGKLSVFAKDKYLFSFCIDNSDSLFNLSQWII